MASEIKVDTVSEKTSGSGVTIDGLLIKDGGISGDVSLIGTTPTFTIGDAGAEDAALVFDGNAQDYYIALDDSADDLLIGLGSTVGTTPAISIDENLAIKTYGDITMTGTTPVLTIGDAGAEDTAIVFDGNAKDFYIALDDSADKLVIGEGSTVGTNSIMTITDDSVTIGDAAAVDTKLVFDGNAQDYYVGLDDSSDSLVVGLGSTLGTTPAITINSSQVATFAQAPVFPDGSIAIDDLNIDAANDIGANIVDADLFIIDDGADGTNRKTAASRLKTYIGDAGLTPVFSAHPGASADQVISNDTLTVIAFDTELFDPDSKFASNAFTPTVAGKYVFHVNVAFACTDGEALSLYLTKNGTTVNRIEATSSSPSGTQSNAWSMFGAMDLDTDDVVGVKMYLTNDDITVYDFESTHTRTNFCGYRIGT